MMESELEDLGSLESFYGQLRKGPILKYINSLTSERIERKLVLELPEVTFEDRKFLAVQLMAACQEARLNRSNHDLTEEVRARPMGRFWGALKLITYDKEELDFGDYDPLKLYQAVFSDENDNITVGAGTKGFKVRFETELPNSPGRKVSPGRYMRYSTPYELEFPTKSGHYNSSKDPYYDKALRYYTRFVEAFGSDNVCLFKTNQELEDL